MDVSTLGARQWRSVTVLDGGGGGGVGSVRDAKPYFTDRNSFITFGINIILLYHSIDEFSGGLGV